MNTQSAVSISVILAIFAGFFIAFFLSNIARNTRNIVTAAKNLSQDLVMALNKSRVPLELPVINYAPEFIRLDIGIFQGKPLILIANGAHVIHYRWISVNGNLVEDFVIKPSPDGDSHIRLDGNFFRGVPQSREFHVMAVNGVITSL